MMIETASRGGILCKYILFSLKNSHSEHHNEMSMSVLFLLSGSLNLFSEKHYLMYMRDLPAHSL